MIFLIIFAYLIFPILMTPILLSCLLKYKKHSKIYLLMICLNLGLIGYNFIPPESYDLSRHYEKLDYLRGMDFKTAITFNGEDPLLLENLWFYLVSITGNYGLLPLTAITLTYFFAFSLIFDFFNNKKVKRFYLIMWVLFVFVWYPLLLPMSGIRFSTALSLSAYSIYLIYFKQNKIGYLYLFLASLIHIGMSLFLVILFISKIKKINYRTTLFIILGSSLAFDLILQLLMLIDFGYISVISSRIKAYLERPMKEDIFNQVLYICKIGINLIILVVLILKKGFLTEKSEEYPKKFLMYAWILILFLFAFYFIPTFINRYSYFILIFAPIIIYPVFIILNKYLKLLVYGLMLLFIGLGIFMQYIQLRNLSFNITLKEFMFFTFFT